MPVKYQWQKDEEDRKAEYKDFKRWQKIVAAKKGWLASDPRLDASLIRAERANQMTVIGGTQVNMNVVRVPYRMGWQNNDWSRTAVHYQVKIFIENDESRAYVFSYSQGSGIKQWPTIREILFSFLQEALLGAHSFEMYCAETGGDEDSRKEYKTYQACVETFEWFRSNRLWEARINAMLEPLREADERGDLNNESLINAVTADKDDDNIPF